MRKTLSRLRIFSVCIIVMLIQASVSAQNSLSSKRDSLLALEQKSAVFPLTKIADCDRQGNIYQKDDFEILLDGPVLRIEGHEASAPRWEADATVTGAGCEIFLATLGGSGRPSLLVQIPGIGSTGAYGTRLAVLLFDSHGRPVPWGATGRFDLAENGIRQIRQMPDGQGMILHNFASGHPAWGGVSYVSELYGMTEESIRIVNGTYAGESFPDITGARAKDEQFLKSVQSIDLSTEADGSENALSQNRFFVRYGKAAEAPQANSKPADISPTQGTNLRIDTAAAAKDREQINLSDGAGFELPNILVIDSASGKRTIIFSPEGTDFTALEKGKYFMRDVGKSCLDLEDCSPNILHALEQK